MLGDAEAVLCVPAGCAWDKDVSRLDKMVKKAGSVVSERLDPLLSLVAKALCPPCLTEVLLCVFLSRLSDKIFLVF